MREPESMPREESPVLHKVFTVMWKSGITKSEIAERLAIYDADLEAVTFGLGPVTKAPSSTNAEAHDLRNGFRIVNS